MIYFLSAIVTGVVISVRLVFGQQELTGTAHHFIMSASPGQSFVLCVAGTGRPNTSGSHSDNLFLLHYIY